MGPYKSLIVLTESNGSTWVLIGPYSFLWIQMGNFGSLFVLTNSNASLCTSLSYASLLVLVGF